MRSGRRNPSQRSSSSSTVASRSCARRCTLRCSRHTASARRRCSSGILSRSHRTASGLRPACSWPMWRGRTSAGVSALPRSWTRAAKPTRSSPGASRAAMSETSCWWMPVSISGWYSARCGTPYSASTSGRIAASAPQARRVARNAEGCGEASALRSSCQMRSGTRVSSSPLATIVRINAIVSGATVNPSGAKRAMKRPARRIRSGSSAKAGPMWRSTHVARSAAPPQGSTSWPSAPRAMALMVKSRRCRSSSRVTDGSASTTKPRWPRPLLRSVRASACSSPVRGCRNTGKSRPTALKPASSMACGVAPTTTQSRSPGGRPSSSSRTAPPTREVCMERIVPWRWWGRGVGHVGPTYAPGAGQAKGLRWPSVRPSRRSLTGNALPLSRQS